MATSRPDDRPTYLWLRGHPTGSQCAEVDRLAVIYASWSRGLEVEIEIIKSPELLQSDRLLLVRGIHARPLAQTEVGSHLFFPAHGNVVPVRVEVLDCWPYQPEEPYRFEPVLRTYGKELIDLRTGLVAARRRSALRIFTLAGLSASAAF